LEWGWQTIIVYFRIISRRRGKERTGGKDELGNCVQQDICIEAVEVRNVGILVYVQD